MTIDEYKPKAYVIAPHEDIDIDGSNNGDYVVCNVHPEVIIYVFGTDWWRKNGGESSFGWSSLSLIGWCFKCGRNKYFSVGSYGG